MVVDLRLYQCSIPNGAVALLSRLVLPLHRTTSFRYAGALALLATLHGNHLLWMLALFYGGLAGEYADILNWMVFMWVLFLVCLACLLALAGCLVVFAYLCDVVARALSHCQYDLCFFVPLFLGNSRAWKQQQRAWSSLASNLS